MIRVLAVIFIFVAWSLQPLRGEEKKLNVLFIASDDLGNVLGEDRPADLQTPSLDRLRERGVFFERAYCQIPLCNPSRASVMTGRRPDVTGVFDLDRHFRDELPETLTLPQLLMQNGWQARRAGKIYHYDVPRGIGTDGLDDPASWEQTINPRGRDVTDEALITNPTPQKPVSAAMSWLEADGTDEEQTDGMIATEAIRVMEESATSGEPFFLGAGFFRPHTPYVAPRKYFERIPLDEVTLTKVPAGDRDDIPAAAIPHNIPLPDYGLPEDVLQKSLQSYCATVEFMDAQVGRLLDAVDRLGLADKTIIVFWSDHGYHLGEHHLWQKRTLFDESARAPLIVAVPGMPAKGKTCRKVVEFVDIYPTVLDLLGQKALAPEYLAGRSLRPLLEDPEAEWEGVAFTQILRPGDGKPVMGRAVTTERWRYIEWNEGEAGMELYDHETDPREIRNLAGEPEQAETIERLRKLFEEKAGGKAPEDPFNPARL